MQQFDFIHASQWEHVSGLTAVWLGCLEGHSGLSAFQVRGAPFRHHGHLPAGRPFVAEFWLEPLVIVIGKGGT